MDDVEDIVEAVFDLEDIVEEVGDPEELLDDFDRHPATVAVAFLTVGAALVAALLLLVTLAFLIFEFGFFPVVAALALVALLATVLAFVVFLFVRTDLPHRVERKIDRAHSEADDTPTADARMTEDEAVDELKALYAEGELGERELEQALDETIGSDDPEAVVRTYEASREAEYSRH